MGQEIQCTLRFKGETSKGKALLESNEILFRGDLRLKIPFAEIKKLEAKDGELHLRIKDGLAVLTLGPKAEQWRQKILHPKSLVEKLGAKAGETAAIHGPVPASFAAELADHGIKTTKGKITANIPWIFLALESPAELDKLNTIRNSMGPSTGVWVIYPKGVKTITERDVREAGLAAGLVDVKVASFSATHTALKFVIPKAKR